jgi:hypothetical protein
MGDVPPYESVALVDQQDAAPHAAHVDGGRKACRAAADDEAINFAWGLCGAHRQIMPDRSPAA